MIVTKEKELITFNKNKIELYKAANPDIKTISTVLIIGVFHGDEPEGEYLINNLINDINADFKLLSSSTVLFIPCLNPDGKQVNTRENARGVDLNRDYPTKNQLNPEKEPELETKFILDVLAVYKPDRILTIHAPYGIINYDGPADKLADEMSSLNGYPVQVDIGYPTPGSFGTYAGKEKKIPVITLELPETGTVEQFWKDNRKALHYFIAGQF